MTIGQMNPLSLIINPNMENIINKQAKVHDFTMPTKERNLDNLSNILPIYIINKIKIMPIPITNFEDNLI